MASSTDQAAPAYTHLGEFLSADNRFHVHLAEAIGIDSVRVESVRQIVNGASRQMWLFDAVSNGPHRQMDPLPLILGAYSSTSLVENNREAEIAAYSYVAEHTTVPVPRVVLNVDDDSQVGMPYFVMTRLDGCAGILDLLQPEYDRIRRRIVVETFRTGGTLARHRVDLKDVFPAIRVPGTGGPALTELQHWATVIDNAGYRRPVTDMVIRYLEQNLPEAPAHLSIVHGDYRIGNVMFTEQGVSGVLDWEMVHVGDPMEDLAWSLSPAWRPLSAPHVVGGALTEEEVIAVWSAAAGIDVDPATLKWWRILNHVKANAIWLSGVRQFVSGATEEIMYGLFGWKNLGREEHWMLEQMGWGTV